MDIDLNNCIFYLDKSKPKESKQLELILLSYDNIEWISSKKELDPQITSFHNIYIKDNKIYCSYTLFNNDFKQINVSDFIRDH